MILRFSMLAATALVLLAGCGPTALIPGAERVRISREEPKECEYLGEVIGDQGGALTGPLTSNVNLEQGALNSMKNKAYQMGGDVVVLLSNRAGQTGNFDPTTGGSSQQTNVVYVGAVYRCRQDR